MIPGTTQPIPTTLTQLRGRLRALAPELRQRHGVARLAVFGSWARGEHRPDSDIDVLVSFERGPSLLTLVRVKHELEDALGLSIDLVLERAIHPRLAPTIQREAVDCAA